MPVPAMTNDQPSTATPFADTLPDNKRPATSTTSDMPVLDPANAEPVDNGEKQDNAPDTSAQPEGEADGGPPKETPGEEKDKTSPQERAAYARERNRRQAAERQVQDLAGRVDQLIEVVSKLAPKDQPQENPRPTRANFDDPEAYDQALEKWASERAKEAALNEARTEQQRQQQERSHKALTDAYSARKEAFEADHPDFEDLVYDDGLKISPVMSQVILEAEDGPAIAYHLAQNPEMAERISKLSPALAAAEIGRISTRLANPPKPKPDPIRPLTARSTAAPKGPADESMDEYGARRLAELRKKTN